MVRNWIKAAAAGFALSLSGFAAADSIDPASYSATLAVGESVTITKTVTIDDEPPTSALLDVMFLMDTTGSMSGVINNAKAAASNILTGLSGFGNLQAGTALYNDSPAAPADWAIVTQNLTGNLATAQAGINGYTACVPGCGGDFPEEGYHGIVETAGVANWRPGSNRFIVMFGDASDGGFNSFAQAQNALAANNITLIGLSYSGAFTGAYGALATGSGGQIFSGAGSPAAITNAILSGVTSSFATYNTVSLDVSGAPAGVGVTYSPGSYVGSFDRSIERSFTFDVTFTGVSAGVHDFDIHALVDGGIVATEDDLITVTVPAPAPLALFGLGLLGLGALRRRSIA